MRSGIHSVTEVPLWIYHRYGQSWRRVVLSAGWAALYVLLDTSLAQVGELEGSPFPVQWRIFLALCILVGGLWKPLVGYALFIAAIAYPLYLISVYVMALALAVLILTAPLAARFLSLALMVVGVPVLAPVHLTPVLPLLAGLWASPGEGGGWGPPEAAVAGGLSALWLKMCAGVSGGPVDLWMINGWAADIAPIYARLHGANSLQTLVYLAAPFVSDPAGSAATALLFNVLQVLAWSFAAQTVAAVRDVLMMRKMGRAGEGGVWTSVLCLVPGLVLIWAGYVVGPSWLQVPGPRWLDPPWLPAQVVLVGAVAVGVDGLLHYLQQPLRARQSAVHVSVPSAAPRRSGRDRRRRSSGTDKAIRNAKQRTPRILGGNGATRVGTRAGGQQARAQEHAQLGAQDSRAGGDDAKDDIIMIELD